MISRIAPSAGTGPRPTPPPHPRAAPPRPPPAPPARGGGAAGGAVTRSGPTPHGRSRGHGAVTGDHGVVRGGQGWSR